MRNEEIVVIRQTLDLLETMEEGLLYVKGKLKEHDLENTIGIFLDFTDAFVSVYDAINTIVDKLGEDNIIEYTNRFQIALDKTVREYEKKEDGKIMETIDLILEPSFKDWKLELEKTLRKYVVS